MSQDAGRSIRDRLREALPGTLKARDRPAVEAIRSALGAIDNAEAVTVQHDAPRRTDGVIAGAIAGVGRADVPRRALDESQMRALVIAEVSARRRLWPAAATEPIRGGISAPLDASVQRTPGGAPSAQNAAMSRR